MRDGPIGSIGSGCVSLFHFMGTSRTAIVVEQVTHKTPLGKIILINIEDIIVDTGLHGPVWDMPFDMIKKYIMSHSWMYAVLEYNFKHNINIAVPHGTLEPAREREISIMELASIFYPKTSELRSINRVRI